MTEQQNKEQITHTVMMIESTAILAGEKADQCCTLLQDLIEDYCVNKEKAIERIKMEYHRFSNLIRILDNLNGQIVHDCEEIEGYTVQIIEAPKNEEAKDNDSK